MTRMAWINTSVALTPDQFEAVRSVVGPRGVSALLRSLVAEWLETQPPTTPTRTEPTATK